MKILLVDDDLNKLRQLGDFLFQRYPLAARKECRSFQSGLKEALLWKPDVIVLDMTMPTYDISPTDTGGRLRPFAGREIVAEVSRKQARTSIVIVTQFESFGEGDSRMTRAALAADLKDRYPDIYVDTIFYSASDTGWKVRLAESLDPLLAAVAR